VLKEAAGLVKVDKQLSFDMPKAATKTNSSLTIYTDGASKGNPGAAAAGIAIYDSSGKIVKKVKKYLGTMTNNQAEYNALLIGLRAAHRISDKKIKIFMDSELIVKQIKGQYKVKNSELRVIYLEVLKQLKKFGGHSINHVMRADNKLADSLANEAIKEHRS